ncbi:glycosyl transferase [Sphaerisporangium rufum]|uniref:Glycosyl transferase n=1 Tax=Sphaerisporangium rufum TaxID=1381558 RepID=A0A919R496_9ACTN|nr:glycosyltransferase family 4 protein [Sphaerisporangium rufum]GII76777.1 glycosyl transferase [Sphaerisporangium rufum]
MILRVHVVLPGDVDDPAVPSGGNVYDRRVCRELAAAGRPVREHAVPGGWPRPDRAARAELDRALAGMPDGTVVLLDGLVACGVPEVVVPHARRLRLAVLVHLPLAAETGLPPALAADLDARERETLHSASAVLATSAWAGRGLAGRHGLDPARVHVVPPGTDPAPLTAGEPAGTRLLCVAAVTPRKGQEVLVRALGGLADLPWDCACVGSLDRAPEYVAGVRRLIAARGLDGRVRLAGPRTGAEMAACYAAADLMVLPSHGETFGMVVTEALARGVPVLTTEADALPETLGRAPGGEPPGLLVPPGDPAALAAALRRWLTDPGLRSRIRASAQDRRGMLAGWDATARRLAEVLDGLRPREVVQ